MHHLDVVTSALVTNPLTAWLAVRLGRDALEDVLDVWPCLLVTTWHDRWAVSGTLLATRDTGSNESNALLSEVLGAAVGVWEVGITTVNDDVAGLNTALGEEGLDEVVDWLACHDEQHHTAWLLELRDELLDALCANNALALGLVLQESVDLRDSTVEGNDGEAVVGGVEDQVLTHDGQTDETEVSAVKGAWSAGCATLVFELRRKCLRWKCFGIGVSGAVMVDSNVNDVWYAFAGRSEACLLLECGSHCSYNVLFTNKIF